MLKNLLRNLVGLIVSRPFIRYNRTGKVALCCMCKCENDYIREFIAYYKSIGVDKIFIYDNNEIGGEDLRSVIADYIDCCFVTVIDYRGRKCCQEDAYDNCYQNHKNEFDWICVFDTDEFLTLVKHKNIHDFLNDPMFRPFQLIHVNWMCYGDNEMLDNDGRPCQERFLKPLPFNVRRFMPFPENNHVKTILRGGLKHINYHFVTHTPWNFYRCCNPQAEECDTRSPFNPYNFDVAFLRHYYTKTIGEWVKVKQKRGYGDMEDSDAVKKLSLDVFFMLNKRTPEKEEYVKMILK